MVEYWVRRNSDNWHRASKEEFIRAERAAGLHNAMGEPDEPGTAGFSYNDPDLRIDGYIGDIRRMSCGCTNSETADYRQWTWHPIGTVPTCPIDREDLD